MPPLGGTAPAAPGGAEWETDPSLVVGCAGWDQLARARALATWYVQAKRDGRDVEHLTPLLAGLAELVPWLKQWFDDPDPDPAMNRPGTQIAALVDGGLRALHLTPEQLPAWRPTRTPKPAAVPVPAADAALRFCVLESRRKVPDPVHRTSPVLVDTNMCMGYVFECTWHSMLCLS